MVDEDRRRVIKMLAKGVVYSAPVVTSLAAPVRLLAQGPSGMMMSRFCRLFPWICMIFGWNDPAQGPGPPPGPGQGSPFPPPPGSQPPPGGNPFPRTTPF